MKYLYIIIATSLFCLNATSITAQTISSFDREIIEQRILEKVNDFFAYIPEIAGKGTGAKEEKQLGKKYIDRALDLFLGEGKTFKYIDENGVVKRHTVIISVNKSDNVKTLSLKKYLTKLLTAPNEKISFDKCTAIRIEEEPVIVDSIKYLAVASVILVQNDSINGKLYINDKEAKRIKAYVQRKVVMTPNGEDIFWIAKLGDISIKEE